MTKESLSLTLTASGVDRYCHSLKHRIATHEKRVAAVDAIITFIATQADTEAQMTEEYQAIRSVLDAHFEQARSDLFAERTQQLQQALQGKNLCALSSLYRAHSRDAYWNLVAAIVANLEPNELKELLGWSSAWMEDVTLRSREASPYPDVIDFQAAGIDPAEYMAMRDLCHFLDSGG